MGFVTVIGIGVIGLIYAMSGGTIGARTAPTAAPDPAQAYVDEYGGPIFKYQAVFKINDCDALKAMFRNAESNSKSFGLGTALGKAQVGMMAATDDRLTALGC